MVSLFYQIVTEPNICVNLRITLIWFDKLKYYRVKSRSIEVPFSRSRIGSKNLGVHPNSCIQPTTSFFQASNIVCDDQFKYCLSHRAQEIPTGTPSPSEEVARPLLYLLRRSTINNNEKAFFKTHNHLNKNKIQKLYTIKLKEFRAFLKKKIYFKNNF